MSSSISKNNCDLKIATKLTDVTERLAWYSLQVPGLEELKPRVGHSLISLQHGSVLMIGGGNHEGTLQELKIINLEPKNDADEATDSLVKPHPAQQSFPARYEFACTKDSSGQVWIFGGADVQNTMNEVLVIDDENVVEIVKDENNDATTKCSGPSPRTQGNNSCIVEWKGKSHMAVFGGGKKGEKVVSDRSLYLFDIKDYTWQTVRVKIDERLLTTFPFGCQPPAVQGHIMTSFGSKILVHGGINDLTLYDGYHWIDLDEENEDKIAGKPNHRWIDSDLEISPGESKPSPRAAHGVAKVSDVNKDSPIIYVFGGLGEKGPTNDLWSFNFETKSWSEVSNIVQCESPKPRLDFAMCTVGLQEDNTEALSVYIILHGGMNTDGDLFNDAWVMKIS